MKMLCYQYHIQEKRNNDWEGDQISPNHLKRCDSRYTKKVQKGQRLVLYIKEWDEVRQEPADLIDILTLIEVK